MTLDPSRAGVRGDTVFVFEVFVAVLYFCLLAATAWIGVLRKDVFSETNRGIDPLVPLVAARAQSSLGL